MRTCCGYGAPRCAQSPRLALTAAAVAVAVVVAVVAAVVVAVVGCRLMNPLRLR